MTKYREILRLVGNQLTTDEIVAACSVSSKTVVTEVGVREPSTRSFRATLSEI